MQALGELAPRQRPEFRIERRRWCLIEDSRSVEAMEQVPDPGRGPCDPPVR
jgi:hypothetical protein